MRLFVLLAAVVAAMFGSISLAYADWAVAVGQNGHSGYAYGTASNYSSTSEARRIALQNCRDEGRNCEVVADGAGQCVAVAFSTVNNGYGWASNRDKHEAVRGAMRNCHEYANTRCEVRASFCDD